MAVKRRGLGRGLEALLSDVSKLSTNNENLLDGELQKISLDKIQKGKYQPRNNIDPHALQELANSISAQGVIQPIVVRSIKPDHYEVVAGERRWRAAKLAGLTKIPALIRELPDEATVAVALIENIQRKDLNPIEEAVALNRLINEFTMTHEQIANSVGRSRASVTNLLRLLTLSAVVQAMLEKEQLEMGHARALLALQGNEQINAAQMIINNDLSVRATEELIRRLKAPVVNETEKNPLSSEMQTFQNSLTHKLNTQIQFQQLAKGSGKIIIKYKNAQALQSIMSQLLESA